MWPLKIERYRRRDREPAVRLLARAFRDNPLNRAVIGPDANTRLRSNIHGMRAHLPPAEDHGVLRTARCGSDLAGMLISAPPFAWPFPAPAWGPRLRCLAGQGMGVARRWAAVSEALREHHALGPHWYLATLGVEPEQWGLGVGSALLADWLAQVDADQGRAYLETDAPRNQPFYERAGFRTTGEIQVFGTTVWLMERPDRASGQP